MLAVLVICSAESCYELDESRRQKKMPDDRLTKSEGSLLLNLFFLVLFHAYSLLRVTFF